MAGQRITGKQRAARISLDYYKQPDALHRVKLWLTCIVVAAALLWWLGTSFLRGDGGRLLYSRGPVANVHAAWDSQCWACHENFKPINDGASFGTLLTGAHAAGAHTSDQLCQNCHSGAAHSDKQIAKDVQACGDCHRDHRGRDASLVQLADGDCTRCHGDLKAHVKDGKTEFENAVTLFAAKTHPEFRSLKADPAHLGFSHKRHLLPGMDDPSHQPNREVRIPFTLADIPESDRERYRKPGQKDTDKVELSCQSCHVLDSGDFKVKDSQFTDLPLAAVLPPRAAGKYMQPIVYENQCKACHPLTVEKATPDAPALTVQHGLQPDQVHAFLTDAYVSRYLSKDRDKLLNAPFVPPSRTRPGQKPGELPADQVKMRDDMNRWVRDRETYIFKGNATCGECHKYTVPLAEIPQLFEGTNLGEAPKFKIERPQIPTVWLKYARFDHSSHRALDCKACHEGAYPDSKVDDRHDPYQTRKADQILVPNLDNCVQCHAPAATVAGKRQGGARSNCTECHKYHHGDAPLQGLGAEALNPKQPLTLPQFLSGQR